jgi:ATP-dependent RNA helicase TDRD9
MEANFKSFSKIIFATNGIFLNYLVHNPEVLSNYSHIVLDEVHERDLEMDFILILLRCLAPEFPKLKIILMSATLNSSKLASYFSPERLTSNYIFDLKNKIQTEVRLLNESRIKIKNIENLAKNEDFEGLKFEENNIFRKMTKQEDINNEYWNGRVL